MKRIVLFLAMMFALSSAVFASSDEVITPIILHSEPKAGTQQRSPEYSPIQGFIIGNTVYLVSHLFLQNVTISIQGIGNSVIWYDMDIELSSTPYLFHMGNSGDYIINIVLSTGQVMEGIFEIL